MIKLDRSRFNSTDSWSYSDSVTNLLYLRGFDELSDFMSLWFDHKLPSNLFLPFVHEMTHAWCFSSVLGTALSELRLNSAIRSQLLLSDCLSPDEHVAAFQALHRDVIMFETAVHVLRPLAEGMALFAEFDATPSSTTLSYPLVCATVLFKSLSKDAIPEQSRIENEYSKIWQTLCENRGNMEVFDKKANLLFSDFTFSENSGGYLLGYLLVKGLFWGFEESLGRKVDSDLFLSFLRWYFFEDWACVTVVLQPSNTLTEGSLRIVHHIGDCLIELMSDDALAQFEKFESSQSGGKVLPMPYHDWERTRSEVEILGRDLYVNLTKDSQALAKKVQENGNDLTGYLQNYIATLRTHRNFLIVNEYPATVMISANEVTVILEGQGEQLVMSPFLSNGQMSIGRHSGYVSLIMGVDISFWTLVAIIGGKVVALSPLGKITEDQVSIVNKFVGSRNDFERFSDHINSTVNDAMLLGSIAEWLQSALIKIDQSIDKLYRNMAFHWLSENQREELATMMRENGFAGILGWNRDLALALGRVSVFASLQQAGYSSSTPAFHGEFTPEQLSAVTSASCKFSLPLMYEAGGYSRSLF